MIKFVAICACLAVAAAKPDVILPYSTGLAPALAYSNGIYNTAPLVYSSPLGFPTTYGYSHLIKKRSVPLVSSYIASAPLATTYGASPLVYSAPWTTTYSSPLISSPSVFTTHLIKKRSAPLIVPSSYITPTTYGAPLVSTYSSIYSSPLAYSVGPYALSPFIKK